MSLHDVLTLLITQAKATPMLEWIAITAAVAEVLLARANKVLLYPAGLISTLIYTWIFIQPATKLYADAILNVYYFIMSIYGWVLWSSKNKGHQLQITTINQKETVMVIVFALAGWGALYLMLTKLFLLLPGYTPSDIAVWDAFISATAWVGMWLLAKRKVENWLLLNISNIVAIPIYINKGMPFTAALTLFLFIVATFGYFEWKKQAQTSLATA